MLGVCSLQAYLMWNFITSQLAKMREQSTLQQPSKKKSEKKPVVTKKKDKKRSVDDDMNELTEVDQNTAKKQNLRSRAQKSK